MGKSATVNSEIKEAIKHLRVGQHKVRCPSCQGERRSNRSDKPLSVSVDSVGVKYHCHHCGEAGGWVYKTAAPRGAAHQNEARQKPINMESVGKTNGRSLEFMH